jgi:methyl-accepting chemotaxis protein
VAQAAEGTSAGAGRTREASEDLDQIVRELQELVDRFTY